jgi:hypothetical protein
MDAIPIKTKVLRYFTESSFRNSSGTMGISEFFKIAKVCGRGEVKTIFLALRFSPSLLISDQIPSFCSILTK